MVTSTRPLAVSDRLEQPVVDPAFAARRFGVEDIGRIADQREHALVADRGQLSAALDGVPSSGVVVELPVAGVEDAADTAFRSAARCLSGIEWASGTIA